VIFDAGMPLGMVVGSVMRCTFAIGCCFDADEIVEQWTSDETVAVNSLPVREFPFDADIDIPVDDPRTGIEGIPDGPGEGTTGPPPDHTRTYCKLKNCDGSVVDLWVDSDPAPPPWLFDPVTGLLYQVDCTTTNVGTPSGPVVGGFEPVDYPPGDPLNPSWVPLDCGSLPPTSCDAPLGLPTSYQLDFNLKARHSSACYDVAAEGAVSKTLTGIGPNPAAWDASADNPEECLQDEAGVWQGFDSIGVTFIDPGGSAPCYWEVGFGHGACFRAFRKYTGDTPVGAYAIVLTTGETMDCTEGSICDNTFPDSITGVAVS
jgi:hypothetical protein